MFHGKNSKVQLDVPSILGTNKTRQTFPTAQCTEYLLKYELLALCGLKLHGGLPFFKDPHRPALHHPNLRAK